MNREIYELDQDTRLWIEQGAIHLKAICLGDPVELSTDEARELASVLVRMADEIDREDKVK